MNWIDITVLAVTLLFIAVYGIVKSRRNKNINDYLLAGNSMPWYVVGISIMATQASAITFLSAPGQAYVDGMRFVQFYFGLPFAMILLCTTFVPIYHKLKVFTAYEFLETRFDLKTRSLAAFLFLVQRGLACGLTIYAPAIILSVMLGWNIYYTNLIIGGLVVLYTFIGGSKAVSITQMQQMTVIFVGMFIAAYMLIRMMPEQISFTDTLSVAGKMGKLNVIDFKFDWQNQYNIWSGIIGGFFLALSYFGTDQSQVGRYLSGRSVGQSRLGLLLNGIIKIPMQFCILLIGALMFVFFQFHEAPIHFNPVEIKKLQQSELHNEFSQIENEFSHLQNNKKDVVHQLSTSLKNKDAIAVSSYSDQLVAIEKEQVVLRNETKKLMTQNDARAETNDTNYIFLYYVLNYLPVGLIGLLIAVIFSASMSSTSSELNALASTSVIDIYKRNINSNGSDQHYLMVSKLFTAAWGVFAIVVAMFANQLGSLIEAVNKLGSLFYGTILGMFVVAFFMKHIKGGSVFYAAIIAEVLVLFCFKIELTAFLWLNMIGCLAVMLIAQIFHIIKKPSLQ
ncbi:MAG TPA: sodium:solute symporter [Bacteroidia bacterium]|nr:sodium:solute symporter [Bacteroidia bacterium]HNT79441.1 sodium:solute symporter [Bacteroidia bacterium]